MLAVTRLLSPDGDLQAPDAVRERLAHEAREFFGVRRVVLLRTEGADRLRILASSPAARIPRGTIGVAEFPVLRDPVENDTVAFASGDVALALDTALGSMEPARSLLALPMQIQTRRGHVLVLADGEGRTFADDEVQVAQAFAAATSATLAQLQMAGERAVQIAQQAALARAAKTLNESLDLNRVLVRISHEAASILDADNAIVYRGSAEDGMVVEATFGLPPEVIGYRMATGTGLAGKVAEQDRSLLTNDYQGLPDPADFPLFRETRSALAVPMHWDGELRGVLTVALPARSRGHGRSAQAARGVRRAGRRRVPQRQRPRRAWCWPPAPTG